MSKPDPTGGKSLEEILASIRKSLADETPPGAPHRPRSRRPSRSSKPLTPDIGGPAQPASAPAKGGGMLSAKLANGAGRGPAPDDGSERAAGRRAQEAGVAVCEPGKPADANAPRRRRRCQGPAVVPVAPVRRRCRPRGSSSAARAARCRQGADAARRGDQAVAARDPARVPAAAVRCRTAEPAATVAKSDKTDKSGKAEAASALTARTRAPGPDAAAGPHARPGRRRPPRRRRSRSRASAGRSRARRTSSALRPLRSGTSRPRSSRRPGPCPQPTSRRLPGSRLPLLPSRPSRPPIRCRS